MIKILIIKHGALGDIILSLNAIYSIKKHFRESNIVVITEKKYSEIFEFFPIVDDIYIDNRPKNFLSNKFFKLLIWFYKNQFEWVFDLQTSNRTKIYFKIFSMFRTFNWSGIEKNCSHPHLNKNRTTLHTYERQKEQLRIAGIKSKRFIKWSFLYGNVKKFKLPKNYIILVPGGSINRPEKRWSLEAFQEIIKYLKSKNIISVLVGGIDELGIINHINFKKLNCINLVGKTNFSDLATISKNAILILGNDTGPMHLLAECSKKKTRKIVLFGSNSNPSLCAPIAENVIILRKKNINDISIEEVKSLIIKNI